METLCPEAKPRPTVKPTPVSCNALLVAILDQFAGTGQTLACWAFALRVLNTQVPIVDNDAYSEKQY